MKCQMISVLSLSFGTVLEPNSNTLLRCFQVVLLNFNCFTYLVLNALTERATKVPERMELKIKCTIFVFGRLNKWCELQFVEHILHVIFSPSMYAAVRMDERKNELRKLQIQNFNNGATKLTNTKLNIMRCRSMLNNIRISCKKC